MINTLRLQGLDTGIAVFHAHTKAAQRGRIGNATQAFMKKIGTSMLA